MGAGWSAPLPVVRYRFTLRCREALRLPDYAGSLLRGQFGAALRRTACMTGAPTCDGCPLAATCPYTAIFEVPAAPRPGGRPLPQVANPYVIEPPPPGRQGIPAGEELSFGMVLTGSSLRQLALVVHAWRRAAQHGFGRERAPADLVRVTRMDPSGAEADVWDPEAGHLLPHPQHLQVPEFGPTTRATLAVDTPLRLQKESHPLGPDRVDARTLMATLLRRITLLLDGDGSLDIRARVPEILAAAAAVTERRDLRWYDWTRYSSRQRQEMSLGGVVGHWTLEGDLQALLPALWLGQWLHVGKNATMGMGRYRLEVAS